MSMVECETAEEEIILGDLKWYNSELGYGFIIDQTSGEDILLGIGAMRRFGYWTAAKGSRFEARVVATDQGKQVSEILEIISPSELDDRNVFDYESLDFLATEYVPARVLWYDTKRGYGFASAYGDDENCFLHWSALEQAGLLAVYPGDKISVRIGRGKNGRVAASVRPWVTPSNQSGQREVSFALAAA